MGNSIYSRRQFAGRALAVGPAAHVAAGSSLNTAAPPAGKLKAGAATSNITPNLGCSMAGGMSDHFGTEVHDELHVRALVLDNGTARLALATCDVCVVPREVVDAARRLIERHAGIPASNVLISAVHTHSAPPTAHLFQSQADPQYLDFLTVRIADAIRCAANRLEPARIGWGVGREERLVFNRRFYMKHGTVPANPFGGTDKVQTNPGVRNPNVVRPAGPTDPDVSVVAVEALDGRPISVYASYALHYMGGVGPGHISADYFGYWAQAMARLAGVAGENRYPPFVPILANACSGNINNINVLQGSSERSGPYVKMRNAAEMLAAECYRTWRALSFTDTAELAASVDELELGVRLPSPADLEKARQILASAPAGQLKDRNQIYARETVILGEQWPKTIKTPVQALRIGSLGIGTFPGEAFVELGLEVKAKSPFQPTMLVELANDYRGYIPTVQAMDEGGYETWRAKSSFLEPQAAPKLTACILRQLQALS